MVLAGMRPDGQGLHLCVQDSLFIVLSWPVAPAANERIGILEIH